MSDPLEYFPADFFIKPLSWQQAFNCGRISLSRYRIAQQMPFQSGFSKWRFAPNLQSGSWLHFLRAALLGLHFLNRKTLNATRVVTFCP